MPSLHRYKCLNPNCLSMTDKKKPMTFTAMNQQPTCPHCGARKLQDWGEAINIMGGPTETSRQTDRDLRGIAEKFGVTNMSNKGGKSIKGSPQHTPSKNEKMVSVGGFQVPESQAMSGQCINNHAAAKKLKSDFKQKPNASPMLKNMTRVVAEHKA